MKWLMAPIISEAPTTYSITTCCYIIVASCTFSFWICATFSPSIMIGAINCKFIPLAVNLFPTNKLSQFFDHFGCSTGRFSAIPSLPVAGAWLDSVVLFLSPLARFELLPCTLLVLGGVRRPPALRDGVAFATATVLVFNWTILPLLSLICVEPIMRGGNPSFTCFPLLACTSIGLVPSLRGHPLAIFGYCVG